MIRIAALIHELPRKADSIAQMRTCAFTLIGYCPLLQFKRPSAMKFCKFVVAGENFVRGSFVRKGYRLTAARWSSLPTIPTVLKKMKVIIMREILGLPEPFYQLQCQICIHAHAR